MMGEELHLSIVLLLGGVSNWQNSQSIASGLLPNAVPVSILAEKPIGRNFLASPAASSFTRKNSDFVGTPFAFTNVKQRPAKEH